jgi:hypothetical protein
MTNILNFTKLELSKEISQKGKKVRVDVYSNGENGWLLEIVDEYWNSTCWEEPFQTAQEAMNEGIIVIETEGIKQFIDTLKEPNNK